MIRSPVRGALDLCQCVPRVLAYEVGARSSVGRALHAIGKADVTDATRLGRSVHSLVAAASVTIRFFLISFPSQSTCSDLFPQVNGTSVGVLSGFTGSMSV